MTAERARSPARFALALALWTAALGLLFGQGGWLARSVQLQANALFRAAPGPREVRLSPVDPASRRDGSDTAMRGFRDGAAGHRWRAVFSLQRHAGWPLAAWIAAFAAAPLAARARLREIAVGALALDAFVMAELAALAALAFAATDAGPAGAAAWRPRLAVAKGLFNSPVPIYSLLFALWIWRAQPWRWLDASVLTRLGALSRRRGSTR